MSAAAEQHEIPRIARVRVEDSDFLNFQTILKPTQVVFNASCAMDALAFNAQRRPSIDIFPFGHTNQIEKAKGRLDQSTELTKSFSRSRRQARVGDSDRNTARVTFRHQVWPNLSLDQNDPDRLDNRKRPAHDWPEIERIVHDLDPIGRVVGGEGKASRRSSRQNAAQIGLEAAQLAREF